MGLYCVRYVQIMLFILASLFIPVDLPEYCEKLCKPCVRKFTKWWARSFLRLTVQRFLADYTSLLSLFHEIKKEVTYSPFLLEKLQKSSSKVGSVALCALSEVQHRTCGSRPNDTRTWDHCTLHPIGRNAVVPDAATRQAWACRAASQKIVWSANMQCNSPSPAGRELWAGTPRPAARSRVFQADASAYLVGNAIHKCKWLQVHGLPWIKVSRRQANRRRSERTKR